MASIVDLMKKPLKHIPYSSKNSEISRIFQQNHISGYLGVAADKLFMLNPLITPACLKLIISIFKFFKSKSHSRSFNPLMKDFEEFDFDFEVPGDMYQFYSNFSLINNLFTIFKETQIETSIDCISYLLCPSLCSWKTMGISPISM